MLLPEEFVAFQAAAGGAGTGAEIVARYREVPRGPDPDIAQKAADAWCAWEAAAISGNPNDAAKGRWDDPVFRLRFMHVVTHYFAALGWVAMPLSGRAAEFGDLLGELLHSALDLSAPVATAWHLARFWSGARLQILPGGLHSAVDVVGHVRAASDRLLKRLQ
ncbi:MAG: hypothetical protein AAGA70_07100 [Pseudomonadota bacterium]